jgi:alpha-tubulin suppressor-like RCC1 family protein
MGESMGEVKLSEGEVKVSQVACGRRHTVLLTEALQVLVAGDNSQGQARILKTVLCKVTLYGENTLDINFSL